MRWKELLLQKKGLVLEETSIYNWHKQIANYKNIDKQMERRFKPLLKHRHTLLSVYKSIDSKYKNLSREADRVFYDNYHEFMKRLYNLIENIKEEKDVLKIEEYQRSLFERITSFEEHSRKNVTVLKEYLEKKIIEIKEILKLLEDDLVDIAKAIEEYKISEIVKVKEQAHNILKIKDNIAKLERDKKELFAEISSLEEKKRNAMARIEHNKERIKNKTLLTIVDDVMKIEQEKTELIAKYRKLAFDIKRFFVKNVLKVSVDVRDKLSLLSRTAEDMLKSRAEELLALFENCKKQISDSIKPESKEIVKDIADIEKNILTDSKKINELEIALKNLKKEIIKDVNALNIYEQSQIIKTIEEGLQDIRLKIESIDNEIKGYKLHEMKEKLQKLVEQFGAVISWKE